MIVNSNIYKIGFREVFGQFNEPDFAVDGSSKCMHGFKGCLLISQVDRIKCTNKAKDSRM